MDVSDETLRRKALNLGLDDDTEVEWLPQSRLLLLLLFGWVLALSDCTAYLPRGWSPMAAVCLRYRLLLSSSQKPQTKNQTNLSGGLDLRELRAVPSSSAGLECSTQVKEIIK